MKFALAPLALALVAASGVVAQESSSSSSVASSTSASSATSSSASASSATSAPAASSSSSSDEDSDSGSGSGSSSVCEALPGYAAGEPLQVNYGCPYNTTSTPTYDSTKLASYLIGAYTRGPEAVDPEVVATQLAKSVTELYPTLTVSFSNIAEQYLTAISASISAARESPERVADSAVVINGNKIWTVAAAAVAVVAGGAFVL